MLHQTLSGNPRHRLVRVVRALPAVEAEGEGQRLSLVFADDGGSELHSASAINFDLLDFYAAITFQGEQDRSDLVRRPAESECHFA
jgi:hypothetical protein